MENEFTDFLNQNWNDKYKAGVTSSSIHSNANGAPNTSTINQAVLQQYHQQSLRGTNLSSANYENIRLAFMQHRHQTTSTAQVAQQHTTTTNSTVPVQRNPSTTAACPKLIDIHSIKGNNAALPFDCQSKLHFSSLDFSISLSLSIARFFRKFIFDRTKQMRNWNEFI